MTEDDLWSPEIIAEVLREVQAAFDAKLPRLKHPYVFDLIKVLAPYPAGRAARGIQ
jgi:hypothetical protein